ncbi:Carnitine transport permease protein OpuCB [Austwickia sp. TVS 96-490-7B]|uniref:ABC transporter permease n=1 Tax=Austwickia sp. TVS 96-490-7B TaxID=2830843 RepID=UPI001C59C947|nr:ABC transporter permease subunit [Austwickia sp. TVS 96-490-7B]MBW3085139.1 Carnitine transport permease protein OpuCB [Austwickia sp. TVS 96-490-7B]
MSWLLEHLDLVLSLSARHAWLAATPLLLGLAVALPLGWAAHSGPRWIRPLLLTGSGLLYTLPSLALFVLIPAVLGTKILDPINVIVAMTVYTVALLVRSVDDGLSSVPPDVTAAATALGYGRWARLIKVDLPLAVPVLAAGLRVTSVSNVSIVSVASLIGVSQLGTLLTEGYQRYYVDELLVGILACMILAMLFDLAIVALTWLATPWRRVGPSHAAAGGPR